MFKKKKKAKTTKPVPLLTMCEPLKLKINTEMQLVKLCLEVKTVLISNNLFYFFKCIEKRCRFK